MNELFKEDFYRATGKKFSKVEILNFFLNYELRYLHFLRMRKVRTGFLHKIDVYRQIQWNKKYGLDIQTNNIGHGLYLGHAHNINVNPKATIGNNCNIAKGVTIGQENRGVRKGAPRIGNSVWIGTNAVIVGEISIGDDVMIAPNSFVNINVPAHSIVLGNPCRIIHRENATEGYINHTV